MIHTNFSFDEEVSASKEENFLDESEITPNGKLLREHLETPSLKRMCLRSGSGNFRHSIVVLIYIVLLLFIKFQPLASRITNCIIDGKKYTYDTCVQCNAGNPFFVLHYSFAPEHLETYLLAIIAFILFNFYLGYLCYFSRNLVKRARLKMALLTHGIYIKGGSSSYQNTMMHFGKLIFSVVSGVVVSIGHLFADYYYSELFKKEACVDGAHMGLQVVFLPQYFNQSWIALLTFFFIYSIQNFWLKHILRLESNFFTLEEEFNMENVIKACLHEQKSNRKNLAEVALFAAREATLVLPSESLEKFLKKNRHKLKGFYKARILSALKFLFVYPLVFVFVPFILLEFKGLDAVLKSTEDCYLENENQIASLITQINPRNSQNSVVGMEFV